ncbi:acyltransferase domain-containing protein [Geodermatophilus sp. DSM 44513]|uniref:ACP S-malonyltransferase n=1 Tax=Geodermatophilus sp. DSM 44513 TaxID=1528104 RepID=UPI00127AFE70|nr:acyltransferase domain-containing protein [Geodermatophilus sp. DSM 44513]WNV75806.1 acyltransferase domain-containing protein [Geodermatophilus sp. DSM 44513]
MSGGPPAVAVVLAGEAGVRAGAVDAWLADDAARQVVDEASAVVGRDVATWWRDPLALSCDTTAAHVEVVVSGVAGYRSLVARGLRPVVVAGHGVGEYAALVATGALPLDQAVELVHWRAELLSLSPRPSCAGMAAVVGPGAAGVARTVVADVGGALAVASVDGPAQVVLAGACDELARAREAVHAAGLDLVRLPGRTACHSPLVETTARHLAAALADLEWSEPDVPVVPNADGRPTRDPQQLARCLRAHLTSTVQWEATSRALVEAGATAVVEVAAVPVLGPLVRQVHPDLPVHLAAGPGTPIPTTSPTTSPEPATAVPVPTGGDS